MSEVFKLCVAFTLLTTSLYGQSIEEMTLTVEQAGGTRIPNDVYVAGLCPDCHVYGLQEYSLGDGTDFFNKASKRDFRIIVLLDNAKILNPSTDQIEKGWIHYVLFVNLDLYENTLRDIEARYLKKYNTYVSKSPVGLTALGDNKFDVTISKFVWIDRSRESRLGFKVIAVPRK